jgi:SAM-dependent methyltransferase
MIKRKSGKNLDSIARHNKDSWEEMASYSEHAKPMLGLDEESAWKLINEEGIDLVAGGKDVLCLASGGGQQSAAFGMLGANVTVFDLAENMLKKDIETAEYYGFLIRVEQGDMRDLSIFEDESFDIVYLGGAAINFVPDANPVLSEATRVLRAGGHFNMSWVNPYFHGVLDRYELAYQKGKRGWEGYAIIEPFIEGAEIEDVWETEWYKGARMFRHTFSTIINLVVTNKLRLLGLWEHNGDPDNGTDEEPDPDPEPGSPAHFHSLIPFMISLWAQKISKDSGV